MNFDNRILSLKTKTWSRDSYGLYDYETKNYFSRTLNIRSPGIIARDGNEVLFLQGNSPPLPKSRNNATYEPLAHVTLENGAITIKPESSASTKDISQQLWQVVRDCDADGNGYLLKCNDIIKVGRVIFKLKQIKIEEAKPEQPDSSYKKSILESIKEHLEHMNHSDPKKSFKQISEEDKAKDPNRESISTICRICLGDNNEDDDPLISPCHCSGSLQFVHLGCLQKWVKSKLNIQENKNLITIYWKNLNCELCKTQFPLNVTNNGTIHSLIPLDTRNIGSYIVMESLSKDNEPTGIHIIDISNTNKILLGRGHDCDLKITDISVSRVHAILRMNKEKVYLEDNNSKFGTLIYKKSDIVFNETTNSASLQNGRTLLKFSIKRPWLSYVPCLGTKLINTSNSTLTYKPSRTRTMTGDDIIDEAEQPIRTDRIDTY